METVDVKVQLPKNIFTITHIEKDKIHAKLKEALALELFNEGVLSFGQAASLADMDKWYFMETLRKNKIELVHYNVEELDEDFRMAEEAIRENR